MAVPRLSLRRWCVTGLLLTHLQGPHIISEMNMWTLLFNFLFWSKICTQKKKGKKEITANWFVRKMSGFRDETAPIFGFLGAAGTLVFPCKQVLSLFGCSVTSQTKRRKLNISLLRHGLYFLKFVEINPYFFVFIYCSKGMPELVKKPALFVLLQGFLLAWPLVLW